MAYDDPTTACGLWATPDDLCRCADGTSVDCATGDETPVDYPFTDEQLLQAASNILFRRTCYRWPGLCERTVHPCPSCHCSSNPCRCGGLYYVLPLANAFPITGVTSVKINGVPFTDFRVDDYSRLVRIDGEAWPTCNNLGIGDTCDEEIEVTYQYGIEPPIEARMAAAEYACELKKACSGGDCALPGAVGDHIKALSRQGVSVEVEDVTSLNAMGASGLTGNSIIDHVLITYGDCATTRFVDPMRRSRQVQINTGTP